MDMKKILMVAASVVAAAIMGACSEGKDTLTVMSYNMRVGAADDGENSWENRRRATPMMLRDKMPDIFGVQEALGFQVDYIMENCPEYASVGVGRDDGAEKGEYMSIFWNVSHIEMKDWGTFWLSETPDVPSRGWDAACRRTATWALMKDKRNGREFYYVNTHLDHRGREAQKNGLALIVSRIKEINPQGIPMVLTGDFNVKPGAEALTSLDGYMQDARSTAVQTDTLASFTGWGKRADVLDYVYYSDFASCERFETVVDEYDGVPYISDHYPVGAVLIW